MILLVDNYDSFVFNIAQYLGVLGKHVLVRRNDLLTIEETKRIAPEAIVISPGPGIPENAGMACHLIKAFAGRLPILGICLGHQAIGSVFGGRIERSDVVVHGKVSNIFHNGGMLFHGIANPFQATRYHSLIVSRDGFPDCLEITAWTKDGLIMGLRHREFSVEGVQFHPESILTKCGKQVLENFLKGG